MNSYSYYQSLAAKYPRLSLADELELMRMALEGVTPADRHRAVERLVMHNLDVALTEACKRFGRNAEQLDEACSIAVVALFQSAKKADPAAGNLFRSFAYPRVKGELWEMRHRRSAVVESRYGNSQRRKNALAANPDNANSFLDSPFQVVSLDEDLGETAGRTLHDVVPADAPSARDAAEHASMAEALSTLPERSQLIMSARFGLGAKSNGGMTLAETGKAFGLTTERVRQIVEESITALQTVMA